MNNMQMHDDDVVVDDLHGLGRFESVGEQEDGEMWLDSDPRDLLGVDDDDSSIFCTDFPPLLDFPCISSSSSSSPSPSAPPPAPVPENMTACLSSSSSTSPSSSSIMMQNPMEISPAFDPQIDIDVMQDLLDTNDMWDPTSVFPYEDNNNPVDEQQEQMQQQQQQKQEEGPQDEQSSEDLGMVFLEWLKSNKESISAEDLRSIKLKKSTIECAAQRLGGGKEGMKQLLKLILEWVQNHHLHKRRMPPEPEPEPAQHCFQNPNPNPISAWIPHPPYYADPTAGTMFPSMLGYMGTPFTHPDYPMVDTAATWAPPPPPLPPHFSLYNSYREQRLNSAPAPLQGFCSGGFGNQFLCHTQMLQGHGERLMKMGSSATKEARKKRMARQRRFLSHHRHQRQLSSTAGQHARLATDANCTTTSHANPGCGNWVFWPSTPAAGVVSSDVAAVTTSSDRRQVISDRRQGWKPEKNLRFLLQKVLKQSDVGNLGRIVLPKKEAEMHLPELEARDGISIAMEDIGTSRVWNMRYRFWPNNKSRMYLLENTGDFVRSNGLQEGDFIVIYSDVKCGKYMIRGVKVRQPGSKLEAKRTGKPQRNLHASSPSQAVDGSGGLSSSSAVKETAT
ncbi:hypothetical protein NE237_013972 [Protea cynaroides]|uniref:TF-B3 domain-containing protein n=1 Tax=Protea cynaroides TaxID=273540 RepID=A0A9Q0H4W8_9MAGN|nr:hypothetical protein NE237_013972 [Protea cynaroides]